MLKSTLLRLRDLMPWHVRRTVSAAATFWRGRKPPFQGVYKSFDEAPRPTQSADGDYAAAAVAGISNAANGDDACGLRRFWRGHALLPVTVAMLGIRDRPARILDFGGAAGIDFSNLLAALGRDVSVDYQVVEVPEVCDAGRTFWSNDGRIGFRPDLPGGDEHFDLVYCWGSIQYLPAPMALLRTFTTYRPKAILIVGSAFACEAFVRQQVNLTAPVPHWVLSLRDTEALMNEAGYRLAFRSAGDDDYNVDNFDVAHRVPNSASLLFVRR